MATSGSKSVAVTSYDTLKFSWERTSYSIANNTSTISWKLELIAKANGTIVSSASKDWSVTVDGTKKTGTNTVGISAGTTKTLASGTKTITHNSDGSKTFSYSFSQEFGITFGGSSIGTKSGSGTGTLNTIPRQATLTSAPNFNDEENPVIKYTNPAGSAVNALEACIKDSTGETIYVDYRSVSKTGTSYTFELTDAERKTLRKAITSGKTLGVKFYLRTTLGEDKYFSTSAKTLTLINYTPTLSPVIKDTNATSTALTGAANTKVIKYLNTMSITTGAAARKEATIKSVKVTCGSKSISTATGTLSNVESGDFEITVKDSRGNTTTQTVKKTLINYVNLSCKLTAKAEMGSNNTATLNLTINGDCFNGSFGASNNTLTVQYRYKTNSGSYGSWTTATATKSGNKYTATKSITGLDYQSSYTVQARAVDAINSGKTSDAVTVKAQPVFDWSANDFAFNVPVSIQGNDVADFVIETGTKAMGSNGTWYWRKWKSGKAECWGVRNFGNMGISTAWGSLFMSESFSQDLPSGLFAATPDYVGISTNYGGFIIGSSSTAVSKTNTGGFRVARGVSETASQVKIRFNVIGRWK